MVVCSLVAFPSSCRLAKANPTPRSQPALAGPLLRQTFPLHLGGRRGLRCQVAQPLEAPAVPRQPGVSAPQEGQAEAAVAATPAAAADDSVLPEEHNETPLPRDVLREFEHKLEADLQSVAVTLTAVTGVIIFWRGVWSLLDFFMGDSLFGDICCIIVGLTIVMWIRLSGVKVAPTFWPPS